MKNTLQATLAALLLSSVAVAPLATLTVMATADAAYAKSDKAGGNGNGKGGDKSQGSSKSSAGGSSKGKSGTKSASTGGGKSSSKKGGVTVEGLFQKLTGKGKKSGGGSAKVASAKATGKPEKGPMHPSSLGNMNGALHANENAILAHIRNGNTNGPVGMMAALAVADYNSADARELLESNLAMDYAEFESALAGKGYASYDDYLLAAYGDGSAENPGDPTLIDPAFETLHDGIGQTDFDEALAGTAYSTWEDYELAAYGDGSAENPGDPALIDPELEALHDNIGVYDPTKAGEFDQAETDAQAYEDAMQAMLDYWNKGDAESENADDLRGALEARLAEYGGVGETVDALEADTTADTGATGTGGCDIEDPECVPDAEVATVSE